MSPCSLSQTEAERLLSLLQTYDCDVVLLRVHQVHQLLTQPDQVWFDVLDTKGSELPNRFGRVHRQILEVVSPGMSLDPGQVVHVSRDGFGVWVQILPLRLDSAPGEHGSQPAERRVE